MSDAKHFLEVAHELVRVKDEARAWRDSTKTASVPDIIATEAEWIGKESAAEEEVRKFLGLLCLDLPGTPRERERRLHRRPSRVAA
ncbi:MAG: hypothetical protein ACLQMH_13525 [Solirubrobacteraceae bacterium]